jgi:hypothetical protein
MVFRPPKLCKDRREAANEYREHLHAGNERKGLKSNTICLTIYQSQLRGTILVSQNHDGRLGESCSNL